MSGGGDTPAPAPSTTTTVNDIPQWEQGYVTSLLGQAQSEAAQPFQQFPGQQVAGFTPDQEQSFNNVENASAAYSPLQNTAASNLTAAGNSASNISGAGSPLVNASTMAASPLGISSYMSPYTDSVVSGIENEANRNWTNNIMPGVNDAFIKGGQFGSGRNAQVLGQAATDFQTGLSSNVANALQAGYSQASTNAQNEAGNLLNAGNSLGNLQATQAGALTSAGTGASNVASQTANTNLTQNQALNAVGQQQQQLNQTNLGVAQQNFQNQVQYPEQQSEFLNQIIRGLPAPTSSTSSTQATPLGIYTPSPLASVGGAGTAALSLNGSQAGSLTLKKGGRVQQTDGEEDMSPLPSPRKMAVKPMQYDGEEDMSPLPGPTNSSDGEDDMEPHGYAEGGEISDMANTPDPYDFEMQQAYGKASAAAPAAPADTDDDDGDDDGSPLAAARPTASAAYPSYSGKSPLAARGMSDSDIQKYQLLAMARGMLSPTKTGSAMESLGNAIGGAEDVGLSQARLNAEIAARQSQTDMANKRLDIQDRREQAYEQSIKDRNDRATNGGSKSGVTERLVEDYQKDNPGVSWTEAYKAVTKKGGNNDEMNQIRRETLAQNAYKNGIPIKGNKNPTIDDYRTLYGATSPSAAPAGPGDAAANKNADILNSAKAAIAKGAPKDAVIKRLKDNGIDPGGL